MKNLSNKLPLFSFVSVLVLSTVACALMAPRPNPTPAPPTPTATPILLSQQVTLVPQMYRENNQTPPFAIKSQTPQLAGSDDPRVVAFNLRLNELVTKEVDSFRQSFLQNTAPVMSNGSFLEVTYTLLSQIGEVWSFKFDFHFYADGAAHPGSYSITLNYDLNQGKELALADLFLPGSSHLEAISGYCITELSKQPFFEGPFADGAQPTPENYRNWNITPDGLQITFDEYQVAPYAAGPQAVTMPYAELRSLIDPQGPLGGFIQ